jgi:hypothetical protein
MIYGLVTRQDPISENAGLFLAQYAASKPDAIALSTFSSKMRLAKQPNGLYARSVKHLQRSVSHDELTGMLATSKIFNTQHRFEIWKQLKANFGAYPAIVMSKKDYLPFNPANYYAWGQYVDSKLSYLFLPFYIFNLFESCNDEKIDTSSKLVYHLELVTMPKNVVNKALLGYYENKMKQQYGENYLLKLRKIYFSNETPDFPLFKVLE